jgi:gluconokinase
LALAGSMIIVVIGVSGSGKTTVAKKLAAALGWQFCEGDEFHPPENRKRMAAGIPLGDADRAPWLAAIAAAIAKLVRDGTSAVFTCSALKRSYRRALISPETPADAVRFVFLDPPCAALSDRLAKRRGHFFPPALLDSQLADLERPGANEPAPILTIDASLSPNEIVERILREFNLGALS